MFFRPKPKFKNYTSSRVVSPVRSSKSLWTKILGVLIGLPLLAWAVAFYVIILKDMPDLSQIETLSLSQTTNITDRNGDVLYKLFDENREYVSLDAVSPMMINAIIAVEDQNFRSNAGIDFMWLARAIIKDATNSSQQQWWSTITQQLVKNLLLTSEKTYKRKMKEIILTLRLWGVLKNQIKKNNPGISSSELSKAVKKKILELYLNYIFLGNNSYGVESAGKTYFATSAKDFDVLQSAILASIPKAPSKYDPHKNRWLLMGALTIQDTNGLPLELASGNIQQWLYLKIAEQINGSDFDGKNAVAILSFLKWLLTFEYTHTDGQIYRISYEPGRKDYALARMLEEGYIDSQALKSNFLKWLNYTFKSMKVRIDAPHFVFWVIDKLKQSGNKYISEYGEDILTKWWLTIRTTLDTSIQKMAVDSIEGSMQGIRSYGADNTALVHLDSTNGDVLAYVWSSDYYNEKIDGQVDMIQSMRQPGSTIKPLFYSLWFMNLPLTLDTPIYDIPFRVGGDDPANVDGRFLWPLPLRKALASSRNIPAIKMYFAVGQDAAFQQFASDLGVKSIDPKANYGYPMAIGAAEMKMIDLANMYTHLSASGRPAEIDPILEIRGPDWSLIYKKAEIKQKQVIPSGVAYLIWKILSDRDNLPSDRAAKFTFAPIKFAHKTGTTNVKLKNDKKLPRDGRLATYTPSKVTLFWAGNTDAKPMNVNAYGGWINNKTRKDFRWKLNKAGFLKNEDMPKVEVKNVSISKISGKLASTETPSAYTINTLGYINNLPTQYDDAVQKIEIDGLCMGKVSELTPTSDIITSYISVPQTFMPNKMDINDIAKYLGSTNYKPEVYDSNGNKVAGAMSWQPTEECSERKLLQSTGYDTIDTTVNTGSYIKATIVKPSDGSSVARNFSLRYTVKSDSIIDTVTITLDGDNIADYHYDKTTVTDIKNLIIPTPKDLHTLEITATNVWGKSDSSSITFKLLTGDTKPPFVVKSKTTVTANPDGTYRVTMLFADGESNVKSGIISISGTQLSAFTENTAVFVLPTLGTIDFAVTDMYENVGKWQLNLSTFLR